MRQIPARGPAGHWPTPSPAAILGQLAAKVQPAGGGLAGMWPRPGLGQPIFFLVFPFSMLLPAGAAIVLGTIPLRKIRAAGKGGKGMARAGIILGCAGLAYGTLITVLFVLFVLGGGIPSPG